jgi:hypothetical protein
MAAIENTVKPTRRSQMSLQIRPTRPSALSEWRAAAALVRDRWALVTTADRRSRRSAYAAYRAALDLEEAAAAVLATESVSLAA